MLIHIHPRHSKWSCSSCLFNLHEVGTCEKGTFMHGPVYAFRTEVDHRYFPGFNLSISIFLLKRTNALYLIKLCELIFKLDIKCFIFIINLTNTFCLSLKKKFKPI